MSMESAPGRQQLQHTMSDAEFSHLAQIAREEAGLVFPPGKAMLLRSRLTRRLRHLRLDGFGAYCALLSSDDGTAERREMISLLTTNVSSFFREPHHFEVMRETALPPLIARARAGGRIRLWSAGCSSGQEAYSLAITLRELAPDIDSLDIRILATDIDPNVVAAGRAGLYSDAEVSGMSAARRMAAFVAEGGGAHPKYRVTDEVRRLVTFRELNLLGPWPMRGRFDVIFCRNVVIYFDAPTQAALWPRFEAAGADGGWLVIGHSERLSEHALTRYEAVGPTAYRKRTPCDGAGSEQE